MMSNWSISTFLYMISYSTLAQNCESNPLLDAASPHPAQSCLLNTAPQDYPTKRSSLSSSSDPEEYDGIIVITFPDRQNSKAIRQIILVPPEDDPMGEAFDIAFPVCITLFFIVAPIIYYFVAIS